jgi:Bacterial regulatory proteins, gntR family
MAVPTYLLIAADLRSKIVVGKMRPGTQLLPEKNLQDEYGNLSGAVSRNTVRDAIEMLVREGLLERRRGQGTFIVGTPDSLPGYTPPTWPDLSSSMQMHRDFDVDDLGATKCGSWRQARPGTTTSPTITAASTPTRPGIRLPVHRRRPRPSLTLSGPNHSPHGVHKRLGRQGSLRPIRPVNDQLNLGSCAGSLPGSRHADMGMSDTVNRWPRERSSETADLPCHS